MHTLLRAAAALRNNQLPRTAGPDSRLAGRLLFSSPSPHFFASKRFHTHTCLLALSQRDTVERIPRAARQQETDALRLSYLVLLLVLTSAPIHPARRLLSIAWRARTATCVALRTRRLVLSRRCYDELPRRDLIT